jgi:DNA mismatch repair protein MutL
MPKIVVLNENMVNMIAAGEVIERPANIAKELLENSIDAGAKKIILTVADGGRKLVSVTDDGCGIAAEDIETAFKPHATSKISAAGDLQKISTMGFRGEALASIASVAMVSLVSKMADSLSAHKIEIDCGKGGQVQPISGDMGTTIEVRDLFYKLPARKKFLKTANTEMTHIIEHFTRIALAHNELDMTLIHNGRQLHHLLSNQTTQQRIAQLFSKTIAEDLIELTNSEKNISIRALLAKPERARANSKFQYVFLNKRFIRDKFISHAIKQAYQGLIEPNKYPMAFLFIEMPLDVYDVNVHPTKIEVRFDNSNLIHSQVVGSLREKLLSLNLDVAASMPQRPVSVNQFGPSVDDGMQEARRQKIEGAMADFFKQHSSGQQRQRDFSFPSHSSAMPLHRTATDSQQTPQNNSTQPNIFLQLHNAYIVTQTDEGFMVIDQHALHERIIYEDLCRKVAEGKLTSQRLLIPETLELTDAQLDAVKTNSELIEKLGIELEPFGPKTVAVQAFPAMLSKVSPADFLCDLLDMLTDKNLNLDTERLLHEILDMAACKAAIKAGQKLSETEMQQLLADKTIVDRASRCPHGRPTTIQFSVAELEKQFKRT